MKFRIDGGEWHKHLSFVMAAVPTDGKGEKVWSEGVYMEASQANGGTVTLVATDIRQIGMKISVKANVERDGKALIKGSLFRLFDLLKKEGGEVILDYDIEKKNIIVTTPLYSGPFACLDPDDFKVLGLDEDDASAKKISMPLEVLRTIVDSVAPSADAKDIETGKAGVLMRCEQKITTEIPSSTVEEIVANKKQQVRYEGIKPSPSKLVTVATDGKKLSKYEIKGLFDEADKSFFVTKDSNRPFEKQPHFEVMAPAGLMQTVYRSISSLATPKDIVNVSIFGGFITFRCGISAVALRLLASELPNWRRILSSDLEFSFVVGKDELLTAAEIANVSNLGHKDDPIVLYINGSTLKLGNAVIGANRATREIKSVVESNGKLPIEEYRQGFRYEHLNHALNYIKTEYVKLNFSGVFKPLMFYPCTAVKGNEQVKATYQADPDFVGVVMPLRINA